MKIRIALSAAALAAVIASAISAEDAARVVTEVRRLDPTFDPREFGNKFLSTADLEHLRDGIRKAGLDATPPPRTDR